MRSQTLNERQTEVMSTCMDSCRNVVYPLMGIIEELGELCEKMAVAIEYSKEATTHEVEDCQSILADAIFLGRKAKSVAKSVRHSSMAPLFRITDDCTIGDYHKMAADIVAEMGDVEWMLLALAANMGVPYQDIADINHIKLESRKKDGTIDGNGDHERTKIE